ncbi:histone deacetylase complex subunit SAP18 isoform X2 [Carcharodon carcharias]|uniref:histone deacetylase complex subunit SAP18 isoform X2 n=1 Tax=Carcharodon carcharias TaxID=13397 RepID=UPI001B7F16A7|nr:histone deacetylase complex subunit SAP18 isoform X2 [Carcharodon carcharias]
MVRSPSLRERRGGNMAVESRVTQEEIKKEPEKPVDREKTCPLLLRVFTTNNGRHHRVDDFARGNVPSSELQIYTWMDATLKELTSLVKEVYPEARKKGTHFSFAIVYPDPKRPGYRFGLCACAKCICALITTSPNTTGHHEP